MENQVKHKRNRARPTFEQVRESERAKCSSMLLEQAKHSTLMHDKALREMQERYENNLRDLADEVNALKAQLDAERAALTEINGSWLAALRYKLSGKYAREEG